MDEQPETTERALSFDSGDKIVRHTTPLGSRSEHELPRVEDEAVVLGQLHQFSQIFLVLLDVYDAEGVVAEHPEVPVDMDVDARRLNARRVKWLYDDATGGHFFANGSI